MQWHSSRSVPPAPGVYRVQVPQPAWGKERRSVEEHFARWTGAYWTCWALTARKAEILEFRGPTAGYLWAHLQ
jgi:hypothetical protein